jgi:hypothetical protein
MLENSVLSRELLRSGRSYRVYLLRGLIPLAIGGLMIALFFRGDPQAGIHSLQFLTLFVHLLVLVGMPTLVAGVLYEEWHSNTLSVLLLTDMSLDSILRGLLTSRVILVLSNLVACFPVLISLMLFGGVTFVQLVQFSLLMVSLALLYGAYGLLGACLIGSREKALGAILFSLAVPQILVLFLVQSDRLSVAGFASWLPAVALLRLTEQVLPWTWFAGDAGAAIPLAPSTAVLLSADGADWLSINLLYVGLAIVCFVISRHRVGRRLDQGPSSLGSSSTAKAQPYVDVEHKPIRGNPLSWLVLKRFDPLLGLPPRLAVALTFALTIGVQVLDLGFAVKAPRYMLGFLGLVLMAWTFFWACMVSAQTWIEERVDRTLELLLATPYSLDEIILWKVDALFWALVTPTIIYSVLVFNLFTEVLQSVLLQAVVLVPFAICCFLYSYVGLLIVVYLTIYFAIRATNTAQAIFWTFGSLGGLAFLNASCVLLGGLGVMLLCVVDGLALCLFLPSFRGRLRSFEPH